MGFKSFLSTAIAAINTPNGKLRNLLNINVPIHNRTAAAFLSLNDSQRHKAMRSSSTTSSSSPSKLDLTILPSLTLYGDLNMRPFRNAWMLQELQLPYKHVPCKPWSRVAKSVHPLGKVPALLVEYPPNATKNVEDNATSNGENSFAVMESAAINTYLGDLSREHANSNENETNHRRFTLVPPPATRERAKYDSLVSFIMTEIDSQSLWIHRKHSDLSNVFGEAPVAVTEARRQFEKALGAMEAELRMEGESCSHLLPDGFSAADILFANCCFWAQQIGWLAKKVESSHQSSSGDHSNSASPGLQDEKDAPVAMEPVTLSPKLEMYLKMCRCRPAFIQANQQRKMQSETSAAQNSKL
ncbi:hypothetical protein HJC23_012880 [Cyclotella cryptica]|uniref:GST N-terminal domain-containing protein n=1 Tax=Cyclotella cryptica TaxID=29204 RepID=A0ABD3Q1G6_9STRA